MPRQISVTLDRDWVPAVLEALNTAARPPFCEDVRHRFSLRITAALDQTPSGEDEHACNTVTRWEPEMFKDEQGAFAVMRATPTGRFISLAAWEGLGSQSAIAAACTLERHREESPANFLRRQLRALQETAIASQPSGEEGEGEGWPAAIVVQRFKQDDPIRPYKYIVLDGTQATDFSNCACYAAHPHDQEAPEGRRCPDEGACHHGCRPGECWRVHNAAPLSDYGEYWPEEVMRASATRTLPHDQEAPQVSSAQAEYDSLETVDPETRFKPQVSSCYRAGDGAQHDEAFRCAACERPVCGYCAEPVGSEWLCPDCEADPKNPAAKAPQVSSGDGEGIPDPECWECIIGECSRSDLGVNGADWPMRQAVAKAYEEITGKEPDFIFSGWGSELPERYRAVVENREPILEPEPSTLTDEERERLRKIATALEVGEGSVLWPNWAGIAAFLRTLASEADDLRNQPRPAVRGVAENGE